MHLDLLRRGYRFEESTCAMGMPLDDIRLPRPQIELEPTDWSEYLRVLELPATLLRGLDRAAFHIRLARLNGANVATAMAFDRSDDDCGIYNIGTLAHARRRGVPTALTTLLLHYALARGCQSASLQSTPIAERVYTTVGFRDLGRILEYVPDP
jgi:ribosomal protein S18 acetylase RimI-like enzyme